MPIIAESTPIVTAPEAPLPPSLFVVKHASFIDQVEALDRGFTRADILGFTPEELEDHVAIALQDNYIVEDGVGSGRFLNGQVAWRYRELTKGYVYERLY